MKKYKFWIVMGLAWVALVIAYFIYWPPRPEGKIYSLHPLEDRTCIILQQRWWMDWLNKPILYRMDENQKILWQVELPDINTQLLKGASTLYCDGQYAFVNLPMPPSGGGTISREYQVMAFEVEKGKEMWQSEVLMLAPEEDPLWSIESNWNPLYLAGSDDLLFSFHQYQKIKPNNQPKLGNLRELVVRAWDKENGTLVWERNDLRPPDLMKPFGPSSWRNDKAVARYYYRDSVFNAYPTNFLAAKALEEPGLLFLSGNHETKLFLDLSTGFTVGKMNTPNGGLLHRNGYYYVLDVPGDGYNGRTLMKFDFGSLQFQPVTWWEHYKQSYRFEDKPIGKLGELNGAGHTESEDLFTVYFAPRTYYNKVCHLMAIDPEADTVVWTTPFLGKDNDISYPIQHEYMEANFPDHMPFNGKKDRYIPFFSSVYRSSWYNGNDENTFCILDIQEQSFTVSSYHNTLSGPAVFSGEGLYYLYDGLSTLSVFNPQTKELEHSANSSLFDNLVISPESIRGGLIWVDLRSNVVVFDAQTLKVISGTEAVFRDVVSGTRAQLGLEK